MGCFELASDFIINDTLKPHVDANFRVIDAAPGQPLHKCPTTGRDVYPKIVAAGSGLSIHLPPIFARLIAMTGKDRPNVVYVGTPYFDRDDKFTAGTESFRRIGCEVQRLMVAKDSTTPPPEEMRRVVVEWADVITVSGGNSLFALLRWQSVGLDVLIKEAAINGTVLCGGSAGCGCWFDSLQTDSLKPEACKLSEHVLATLSAEERLNWSYVRISGMGYINAFCIPHVDTVGSNNVARVDIAKKMLLDHCHDADGTPIVGLGIDEKAAVIYEDGRVTVVSGGVRTVGVGPATCHVLFVNDRNEVQCIPVPPSNNNAGDSGEEVGGGGGGGGGVSLDELIDRAVRSAEAVQSPLDLMVRRDVADACHRRGCSGNVDMMDVVDAAGVASVTAVVTMGALERSPSIMRGTRDDCIDSNSPLPTKRPHALGALGRARSNTLGASEERLLLLSSPPLPRGLDNISARTRSESIEGLAAALAPLVAGTKLVSIP